MYWFNIVAGVASIASFVVSVWAWLAVDKLKRRYDKEYLLTRLLGKAREDLGKAQRAQKRPTPAMGEATAALRRAIVHMRGATKYAELSREFALDHLLRSVDNNFSSSYPGLRVVVDAIDALELMMTETENAFEEMKRK